MGANNFIAFPAIPAAANGAQTSIDLFSLVPPNGLGSDLTFICTGSFLGTISIQGSTDGNNWSTLCQFDADVLGDHTGLLSPEFVPSSAVRYLRAFVGATIPAGIVTISVAAEQDCSGTGHSITLNQFGTSASPITNSDGFAVRIDAEWFVDLSEFGTELETDLSVIAKIGASPLPGSVSLWASDTQGDTSLTGTLLASVSPPNTGTGGNFVGFSTEQRVLNPGGSKYITIISHAGASGVELPGTSTTLTYYGAVATIKQF